MSPPRVLAGTSGFAYPAWKGAFYPADARSGDLLEHYARALPTVEINNTFYRMPRSSVLEGWCAQVPEDFRFVLKASRRITHFGRLKGVDEALEYQWRAAEKLGARAGPTLFQLPPALRADAALLRDFLAQVPAGQRAALEFRHASWDSDEVRDALRAANAATCGGDDDGDELPVTADWGYLRLRGESYDDADLDRWAERLRAAPWNEVYVFFKHEDEALAPRWARGLLERCA